MKRPTFREAPALLVSENDHLIPRAHSQERCVPDWRRRSRPQSSPSALALRRLAKSTAEVVELVEIPEGEADFAALPGMANGDLCTKRKRKLLLERARVGVDRGRAVPRASGLAGILAQPFDVPDRQAFGDDAVGDRVRVGDGEQGARVSGGNLPPASRLRVCSGRLVRRNVLATWLRLLPTTRAMSPCE